MADNRYNHKTIETKWQKAWEEAGIYNASDKNKKAKKYTLIEFPYPSGEGLHMGHLRPYVAGDVYARFARMNNFESLYPIGWDAFGLPAENFAIKTGVHPSISTAKNIENAKRQIKSWGIGFDWSREVNTSDPDYYKWTQWIFLQFYKAGLAYEATGLINWCPKDKTGLANEEVIDGCCERCGTKVEKKETRQWYLKITAYAEKLLEGLKTLKDWPEPVKLQQENWIGKSEGAEINFPIFESSHESNFLILHGRNGSPDNHTFPWLRKSLEEKGFKVQVPALPNTAEPSDEAQTDFVQKNCEINEHTVIIGHSFGGVVALRLLERGIKVKKVFLVCTPFSGEFLDKKRRASVTSACKKGFDFKKIRQGARDFGLLYDTTDYVVPMSDGEAFSKSLGTPLIKIAGREPHLSGSQEPEVLASILPYIKVFTTRPDTLFGATYMVLAPEHPFVASLLKSKTPASPAGRQNSKLKNLEEVRKYIEKAKNKTEIQRTTVEKDKTGVELKGIRAINPATKEEIPVWVADYVLMNYGTGAIMAVPAHDERDFAFAKKYNLPIKKVIKSAEENCVIVHGCPSTDNNDPETRTYDKHWIPWIKEKLESVGIKTYTPLMPQPWQPIYKDWKREIEKLPIDENTILIGHSCAAAFLTKWLGETKKSVKKLIFVGGARIPKEGDHTKDDIYLAEISSEIKNRVKNVVLFISNDDPRHVKATRNYAQELNGRIIELENRGHFTFKDMKTNEFPELLEEILQSDRAVIDYGVLINSGKFDGIRSKDAIPKMAKAFGKPTVQYKLRDWVFSRQRYWGEPIPIIHCDKCGGVPVPEDELPVELPKVEKYEPTGTGESPLAAIEEWVNVKCPKCNGRAKRETNTMPQWAGSSWYWLRYSDPRNDKEFVSKKLLKYWQPVDVYFGGLEHTTLHLLYSRFWNLFLFDQGLVTTKEPFMRRVPHGIVLASDGEKMSKSRGNVVNPDEIAEKFGADTLRMYEMFLGPHEATVSWSDKGVVGVKRFLDKAWKFGEMFSVAAASKETDHETLGLLNRTIKKITNDIETFSFNTAISALMILLNQYEKSQKTISVLAWEDFLKLLAPFAPHITEELWHKLGHKDSIHLQPWPKYDEKLAKEERITVVVQISGKMRSTLEMDIGSSQEAVKRLALSDEKIKKYLEGKKIIKEIFVPDKLINFVVK